MKEVNKQALKTLLKYFARKKYTVETVKRWAGAAMEYIIFLESNGRTVDDIGDLLNSEGRVVGKESFGVKDFLDTKTKYEASYMNYLCHVLKRFYVAWEKHFPIPNEEFPKAKKEPVRIILNTEEILKIQETAKKMWIQREEQNPGDILGLRDYCMILIGIDCGPRRLQISRLNIDHYDDKKGTLFVPAAKGGRDTTRVLSKILKNALRYYLERRKKLESKNKAMFLLPNNERVTTSAMSDRFSATCKEAGVYAKGVGFHALRRAKVWRLKKAGFNEEEINNIMGWKRGSKMSHIYGELDQTELQQKAADIDDIFKRNIID